VDYQYDNLNRLTSEQITSAVNGNRNFGYTYDLAGNRLTKTDSVEGTTAYAYDANNRLTQTAIGTTVNALTYDLNGSLLKVTDGTKTTLYTWANDGENRLLSVNDGTNLSRYIYNGMGDRVASIDNGVRTNYLTAGRLPQVVLEYDANGVTTADYTLGLDLIRKRADGREGYYHTDGLGSTRVITDNVGLVLNRYDYDAFGVTVNETAAFGNSFQFAGEQKDSSGLSYNRARYYNSTTGRFISKDPYGGDITDPYSQHGYQYAHGNPVRYTDPTGYFSMSDAVASISIASILTSTSASIGYVGAKYLLGQVSGDDIYGLFGDWVAGYSNGVTGGISADIQNSWSGTIVKPRDGFLFAMGNVAGIGTSFLIGLGGAIKFGAKIGQASFSATYQVVVNGYGAGKGIGGVLRDGRVDTEDVFNLLNLLSFAGPILGSVKGLAGMRAANSARIGSSGGVAGAADSVAETAVNGLKSVSTKVTKKCFEAGTEILTAEGNKNIEDIQVGDWVLSENPVTGEVEYKQVTETFVRRTEQLVDLYVDGQKISTTGEHPFWTPDKGWVEAKDLVVGSLVVTEDGRVVDIDGMEHKTGSFTVYNFSVEGFHSYFVSDLGILVHNARCGGDTPNPALEGNNYHPDKVKVRQQQWRDHFSDFFDPKAVAREHGYHTRIPPQKAPFDSHGQPVFFNGKNYISPDVDAHNVTNGWKMFDKRYNRIGTYSQDLKYIKE
jgi:RHS repeat-associated protein